MVFECSGNERAAAGVFAPLCPGGTVVYVGIPLQPIAYDVAARWSRKRASSTSSATPMSIRVRLRLMASGKLNVKPLITDTFRFQDSVAAFDFAVNMPPSSVKAQIVVSE
jgi:D-xylulose reductase